MCVSVSFLIICFFFFLLRGRESGVGGGRDVERIWGEVEGGEKHDQNVLYEKIQLK